MTWCAAAGGFGWLILFLTLIIVGFGGACAARRATLVLATTVLLAGVLPLGVGLLGVLSGQQENLEKIEKLRVLTENDLQHGNERADTCLALGVATTLVCEGVALIALARATKAGRREPCVKLPRQASDSMGCTDV